MLKNTEDKLSTISENLLEGGYSLSISCETDCGTVFCVHSQPQFFSPEASLPTDRCHRGSTRKLDPSSSLRNVVMIIDGIPYLSVVLYIFQNTSFDSHEIGSAGRYTWAHSLRTWSCVSFLNHWHAWTLLVCLGFSLTHGFFFSFAGFSGQDFDWADYHKQLGAEEAPPFCFRNVRHFLPSAFFYCMQILCHKFYKLLLFMELVWRTAEFLVGSESFHCFYKVLLSDGVSVRVMLG